MTKHNRQVTPSTIDNYGLEHISRFKSPGRIPPVSTNCNHYKFAATQISKNQYQTQRQCKERCNNFVLYLTETDGSTNVTDTAMFLTCR